MAENPERDERLGAALRFVLRRYLAQVRRWPFLASGALLLPAVGDVLTLYAPPLVVARLLGAFAGGRQLTADEVRPYLLTFVGYNAGPGRALEWVRKYGDPRGGAVDPVDWIERIPFDETRDYVQKVMENLQLYRSRTGHPLSLTEDLVRGGPQG